MANKSNIEWATVTSFDVFKRMSETGDSALQMAPLGNVSNMQKTKHGTLVTIGVGISGFMEGMMNNKFVGGLFIIDRERFEAVKAEMEKEEVAK